MCMAMESGCVNQWDTSQLGKFSTISIFNCLISKSIFSLFNL